MSLPPDNPENVPADHLIVFIGHSSDASEEAKSIYSLEHVLQRELDNIPSAGYGRQRPISRIHFWEWMEDSAPAKGGQSLINPYIQRADIAVFVFKNRVGQITWAELGEVRCQTARTSYVITIYPASPPDCSELGDAKAWADLLEKMQSLSSDWNEENTIALLPMERYRDRTHLLEIMQKHLSKSVLSIWNRRNQSATQLVEKIIPIPALDNVNGHFLDQLTKVGDYNSHAVQYFRKHLRSEKLIRLPMELSDGEFLDRLACRENGLLNRTGVLLFTHHPDSLIPGAIVRCTFYHGNDKTSDLKREDFSGPLFEQIEKAFEFVRLNVDRKEAPTALSARTLTTYIYPMIAVRELLANAVCHRDYSLSRMSYVRIFSDRIEIENPGNWSGNVTLEEGKDVDLGQMSGPSSPPNYRLASAFSTVDLVEIEGSGVPRAMQNCRELGAPLPVVRKTNNNVVVVISPGRIHNNTKSTLAGYDVSPVIIEMPDSRQYEVTELLSTTIVRDLALQMVEIYIAEGCWPLHRGNATQMVVDKMMADGSRKRIDQRMSLHDVGVCPNDILSISPERTAGCFPAETNVKLSNGLDCPIFEIKPGTEVKLGMVSTDGRISSLVIAIECRFVSTLVQINEGLWVSESQALYANGKVLQVRELQLGDILLDSNKRENVVVSLKRKHGEFEVFNLVLEGERDTFVANDVVVYHMHARETPLDAQNIHQSNARNGTNPKYFKG